MNGNYIKINRSVLEWEWYRNINTKVLFFHMILKANWKVGKFEGKEIPRGSFVSSYPRLAEECDLTVNEIRTALKHLVSTGEITVRKYSKYSVFTVNNYCVYQEINSQSTDTSQADHIQSTGSAQSVNSLLTTIEEGKKEKRKEGNKNNTVRFTPPDLEMIRDYCKERNNSVDPQVFLDFYSSKGWMVGQNKMKDWKAAVRTWERSGRKNSKPADKVSEVDSW